MRTIIATALGVALLGSPAAAQTRARGSQAALAAMAQVGSPYVWGAASPHRGFDCSGLTQWAWRQAGVPIPRVSWAQLALHRVRHLRPGDLLGFYGGEHVGLYVGHGRFVHAPNPRSRVRLDHLHGWYRNHMTWAVRPGKG